MPTYSEMVHGGGMNLVESGELAVVGETPWMALRGQGEHVFTCDIDAVSSPVGSFVVEARRVKKDGFGETVVIYGPTAVLSDFPRTGRLAGNWDVRMRCSSYTSGTYNLAVAQ